MEVLYPHCAGLDVHKKTVVTCVCHTDARGRATLIVQTFETTTPALLALQAWLSQEGVTHVAMEATGSYWKPVYNLLEAPFTTWVVNPAHMKNVPGRRPMSRTPNGSPTSCAMACSSRVSFRINRSASCGS